MLPHQIRVAIGRRWPHIPFDHAGQGETSLLMALCPEAVDLAFLSDKTRYTRRARQSSWNWALEARSLSSIARGKLWRRLSFDDETNRSGRRGSVRRSRLIDFAKTCSILACGRDFLRFYALPGARKSWELEEYARSGSPCCGGRPLNARKRRSR